MLEVCKQVISHFRLSFPAPFVAVVASPSYHPFKSAGFFVADKSGISFFVDLYLGLGDGHGLSPVD